MSFIKFSFSLVVISLLFICVDAVGQSAPPIEWQNTIGGIDTDQFRAMDRTLDGGYILGGSSESNISGDKTETSRGGFDYWIIKLDSSGAVQWDKTIGGSGTDILHSIKQTIDKGYICSGHSASNISGDKTENSHGFFDYWVVKIDSIGTIEWQNTIGGNKIDQKGKIEQTYDGGYILGGQSDSDISGDKTENSKGDFDFWVVRLDSIGNILWQKTIGGSLKDYFASVKQTADGGYLLGGHSASNISGDKTENSIGGDDYWVVKLDSLGAILWQNTIGGDNYERFQSLELTSDNGSILSGRSWSGISGDKTEDTLGLADYWIVKLDSTGSIMWQNTIGGSGIDEAFSTIETADMGYIVAGISDSEASGDKTEDAFGASLDFWVLKLDSAGVIIWQNTIGGTFTETHPLILQDPNGSFVLAGSSDSDISGDKTEANIGTWPADDYWILKLEPDSLPMIELSSSMPQFCRGTQYLECSISGQTYQWEWNSTPINGATSQIHYPIKSGNYRVLVIYNNGDSIYSTNSYNLNVYGLPSVTLTNLGASHICLDDSTQLSATSPTGVSYQWKRYNKTVANGAGITSYYATKEGGYKVFVTDNNGCSRASNKVFVTGPPSGVISSTGGQFLCIGDSLILSAAVGAGYTYQWKRYGIPVSSATSSSFTVNKTGKYKCIITDSIGCIRPSQVKEVTMILCPARNGISSFNSEELEGISITPNPASSAIRVSGIRQLIEEVGSNYDITISDMSGRNFFYQENLTSDMMELDISGYQSGIYLVKILYNNGLTDHVKFVVSK